MDYEIRQLLFAKREELQAVVDLQNIVYEGKHTFSVDGFVRRYINNPMGRVISFNAFYGDQIVAHYACTPYKMIIDGREVMGLLDMATVTHPEHRGKGLFKRLAQTTYDYAKEHGFEFVVGVANANSFPGYMKYFPFTYLGRLQVKMGCGNNIQPKDGIRFSGCYDEANMNWRATCGGVHYKQSGNSIEGKHGRFVRTYMGGFDQKLLDGMALPKAKCSLLPKLYVGIGADVKGLYFHVPKFIKHSPFNLIFLDLTEGKLPKVTKDNIMFQLWDFDVA